VLQLLVKRKLELLNVVADKAGSLGSAQDNCGTVNYDGE
jgi:hypothetical protein